MNPTVEEAAAMLRCSRRRVFELLADGTLDRAPRYGRATTVTRESVERALSAPAPAPSSPRPRVRGRKNLSAELAEVARKARSAA